MKLSNDTIIVIMIWVLVIFVVFIFLLIYANEKENRKSNKTKTLTPKTKEEPKQPPKPLYEKKPLVTANERAFQQAIWRNVPPGYRVIPQICLVSIIQKNYNNKFVNELFRIVDFGIFDEGYNPIVLIEINDSSHYEPQRIARDYKVKDLLEKANIPLITLWTGFGINDEYIKKRLNEHCK